MKRGSEVESKLKKRACVKNGNVKWVEIWTRDEKICSQMGRNCL